MSAALPLMVKHASAVGHMSKERVVKGIEQRWCRASKSARGDGKFTANAATPLQHPSAGDSPPTTLLYFTLAARENINLELENEKKTWEIATYVPGDRAKLSHFARPRGVLLPQGGRGKAPSPLCPSMIAWYEFKTKLQTRVKFWDMHTFPVNFGPV